MVRRCGGATTCLVLTVTLALASGSAAPQQPVRGLTAAPQLARVYGAIFDARFDEVPQLLRQACGPAPKDACAVLDTVALWWRIQLDPLNTTRDGAFQARVESAIAAAEAWTVREPQRAEAWFYLGGAYGARAQWRVLRHELLSAARDGKRIKDSLERALALDPTLQDAYFGIGLYHYYADVAPTAAKVLRWLLFLPGGDRVQGLNEMLRAREKGQLARSEADYQLHVLYLWYEQQTGRALELLGDLRARHPRNPHFAQAAAEIQDVYQHDLTASLRSWQALLEAARTRRVAEPAMAEAAARLGAALQLDRLFETDAAIEHLRAVIAARPSSPFGAMAQAHLQLAQALDRLGHRAEAAAEYRAALAATPAGDPLNIGPRARAGVRGGTPEAEATAYRLSLEGWRALERGSTDESARALAQSLALRPGDPVTRYRHAQLLLARKDEAAALMTLEGIVSARASAPPTIYANACLDAARLHEQRGSRTRAIELYGAVRTVFGADERTKDAARRALTRLAAS